MSNVSLAFNEFPGTYASSHNISTHRASENMAGVGQVPQRYHQSSSSLASALTPVVPKIEGKRAHMWSQTSSDKTALHAQLPGSSLNNKGWYTEHRIHGQTIARSASVMPERQMNGWNSVNGPQGGYEGNHSPLAFDYDTDPRRAFTPAPQDVFQLLQQQGHVPPLHGRPGIASVTPSSVSDPSVSPTKHQSPCPYVKPSLGCMYSGEAMNDDVPFNPTPTYLASPSYPTAEGITPSAGQLSVSPEFLYVNVDNPEDEPTIHCPYKWCKSTFTRSNDLARHLATASIHRDPVPVDPSKRCRLCGEEFSRSDARNRHEIKRSCGKKRTRRAAPA